MRVALQTYESAHPEKCELLPREDSFYGVSSTGKLAKFLTWVYIPAVKDAGDKSEEGKNMAFARLLERAIESRSQIDEDLDALRKKSVDEDTALLKKHEASLTNGSDSLKNRLSTWSRPGVALDLKWNTDERKSVQVQKPLAGIQTGEDGFLGSLSRMGHGLQRSYLLALLQELAEGEESGGPTLVLGVEEPELYQHPPQHHVRREHGGASGEPKGEHCQRPREEACADRPGSSTTGRDGQAGMGSARDHRGEL
jgi:hypothetical protein